MSVTNKEKNFISAVVYLHNDGAQAVRFFKALNAVLDQHFEQYELVAVDDACADDTIPTLRDWAKALEKPLTILHLSLHQGRETAMNAGLDAAIGDYVYEFDSTQTPYPIELVFEAYRAAMAGSDIVSVCPRSTAGSSKNVLPRVQRQQPFGLQAAHRCVPPGQPPRHQPRACFQ